MYTCKGRKLLKCTELQYDYKYETEIESSKQPQSEHLAKFCKRNTKSTKTRVLSLLDFKYQ